MTTQIAVIGSGLMGAGIAQVFAANGYAVRVYDSSEASLQSLTNRVRNGLQNLGLDDGLAVNVQPCTDLSEAVAQADVVFEAGPEKLAVKQEIFSELARLAPREAIFASNTSVIPIRYIGEHLDSQVRARIVGAHWWNPAPLIPLVEVIRTEDSADWAIDRVFDLLLACGKLPVRVNKDVPGFVGNRLQHALWREAHAIISNGVCDAQTVDLVVKNSFGLRLPVFGPIENADLVGLDLTLDIHSVILADLDKSSAPLPSLTERVNRGELGAKTGRGFLEWPPGRQAEVTERLNKHLTGMIKPQKERQK